MNINIMKCKLVRDKSIHYETIVSCSEAVDLLRRLKLHEEAEEVVILLCFSQKGGCIGIHEVSRGELGTAVIHPREVFKRALLNNAASIIIAHNHPSGVSDPSMADRETTERINQCGKLIGIKLSDSIIITEDDFYSFAREGDLYAD